MPDSNAPKISRDEVQDMENALEGLGWVCANDLCAALFLNPNEAGRRKVRAIAEAGGSRFISGQNGYKLAKQATAEEVKHAVAWFRSQANKMLIRAKKLEEIHGLGEKQKDLFK